jgi:general stress protein 26
LTDPHEATAAPLGADIQRLRALTRGCDTHFLIRAARPDTARAAPLARPMVFRGIDDQGCVWHFVDGDRFLPTEDDVEVALAWCDPLRGRWVTATGDASLVRDRARMGRLWTRADEAWFPQGLATAGLALLRVTITQARYWEVEATLLARARWHLRRALGNGAQRGAPTLPTTAGTLELRPRAPHEGAPV